MCSSDLGATEGTGRASPDVFPGSVRVPPCAFVCPRLRLTRHRFIPSQIWGTVFRAQCVVLIKNSLHFSVKFGVVIVVGIVLVFVVVIIVVVVVVVIVIVIVVAIERGSRWEGTGRRGGIATKSSAVCLATCFVAPAGAASSTNGAGE